LSPQNHSFGFKTDPGAVLITHVWNLQVTQRLQQLFQMQNK